MRLREYERRRLRRTGTDDATDASGQVVKPVSDALRTHLAQVPDKPGCYLFLDRFGNVIYVGKAKRLKRRVGSYFTPRAASDERTEKLVRNISDIRFVTTAGELDALLLEFRLIKLFKPLYNSQMKPDKPRPYLRVSASTDVYQTLSAVAEKLDDGAEYFDFFTDNSDIKRTLQLFAQVWALPRCGLADFSATRSTCIYRTIDGCLAPCVQATDADTYARAVAEALSLMHGRHVVILDELADQRDTAIEDLHFEQAASLNNLLEGLNQVIHRSHYRYHLPNTGQVMVLIRPHRTQEFSIFLVNDGFVFSRIDFGDAVPDAALPHILSEMAAADDAVANHRSSHIPTIDSLPDLSATIRQTLEDKPVLFHELYISASEEWLADCLTEVGADKRFVLLPEDSNQHQQVITEALETFC